MRWAWYIVVMIQKLRQKSSRTGDKAVPLKVVSYASSITNPTEYRRADFQADSPADSYGDLYNGFQWQVPRYFNIAQDCCGRWAQQKNAIDNIAVYACYTGVSGLKDTQIRPKTFSFLQLQQQANRLSNLLKKQGVKRGDRVAIVMPQRFETAVAYIAVLQMGAVATPLSMLFGPEALEYRLQNSDAVAAVVDATALPKIQAVRSICPALKCVIAIDDIADLEDLEDLEDLRAATDAAGSGAALNYAVAMAASSDRFTPVNTLASDAAILIYTSGTTGPPKGALIPHRALIGNLSGFVCSQNWFGFDPSVRAEPVEASASNKAIFWSPADWAWTGGLMDALLPTLYFGRPIVACNGRFSPETALQLMRDCGVTHTFLFPTALKSMMKAFPGKSAKTGQPGTTVRQQFKLKLQAIMSGGEAVGDAVFGYCQNQLGVQVNEIFGQTEVNYIVGACNLFWPPKPGSMGKPYPGHWVQVIDGAGDECAVGVPGDIAVNRFDTHGQPDPVVFLGYWKNDQATQAKFTGSRGIDDWCRTGDLATRDADGYLWYQGRADDIFKAAGYRIGPGEVENCLVKHPAVANAAVVPKPDAQRGAVVKAYVVIAPDFIAARACYTGNVAIFDSSLRLELQNHVKGKLAPYEYPKEIEFVDELPMTTTGKVQRRVLRLQEEERARLAASE
jgi:acetyl-CoA synthetase